MNTSWCSLSVSSSPEATTKQYMDIYIIILYTWKFVYTIIVFFLLTQPHVHDLYDGGNDTLQFGFVFSDLWVPVRNKIPTGNIYIIPL